jgi:quinol monooxygenase YgiN
MVLTTITLNAQPRKRKELLQTVEALSNNTQKKRGNISSQVYLDCSNENRCVLIEEWKTQTDVERHLHSDDFKVLLGATSIMSTVPELKVTVTSFTGKIDSLEPSQVFFQTGGYTN